MNRLTNPEPVLHYINTHNSKRQGGTLPPAEERRDVMTIEEQIEVRMKEAAKKRDSVTLSTLRMVRAALHNKQIELKKKLDDKDVLQVLSSLVKQHKDSISQFKQGGRSDLVAKEEAELVVINEYMPDEMSEEEIKREIDRVIEEVGAAGPRDMGKVMKALMPVITGKADGKVVSEMVKAALTS